MPDGGDITWVPARKGQQISPHLSHLTCQRKEKNSNKIFRKKILSTLTCRGPRSRLTSPFVNATVGEDPVFVGPEAYAIWGVLFQKKNIKLFIQK